MIDQPSRSRANPPVAVAVLSAGACFVFRTLYGEHQAVIAEACALARDQESAMSIEAAAAVSYQLGRIVRDVELSRPIGQTESE